MMSNPFLQGLEFKNVFIVGMEETIFSRASREREMEESGGFKLCGNYPAPEAACLTLRLLSVCCSAGLTNAKSRSSRFISEIPAGIWKSSVAAATMRSGYGGSWQVLLIRSKKEHQPGRWRQHSFIPIKINEGE